MAELAGRLRLFSERSPSSFVASDGHGHLWSLGKFISRAQRLKLGALKATLLQVINKAGGLVYQRNFAGTNSSFC